MYIDDSGQEMLTLSGTHNCTSFVHDFTHSLYIYIHYILLNLSGLGLCLQINDSGLFAWINLAALSRTYFSILVAETFTFVMEPIMHQ